MRRMVILGDGCRLLPRPETEGRGEETRIDGWRLDDLPWPRVVGEYDAGMLGTGGASRAAGFAAPRFGDGSRKVPMRSVMEPELSLR